KSEMTNVAERLAKISLWTASVSSGVVGLLLLAASCNLWMEGANLHPTPRINAFTVGMALTPISALAWIVFLWSRWRSGSLLSLLARLLISAVLVLGSAYCFFLAMFDAFFVG